MALRDRLVDPNSSERRPRRAAYALPTLFTAGNIFLGYLSILRSFKGAVLAASNAGGAPEHFAVAAKAIGGAFLLDGLDGRIARMTNTTSDFGREMDSLADVISFGIAPPCWPTPGVCSSSIRSSAKRGATASPIRVTSLRFFS